MATNRTGKIKAGIVNTQGKGSKVRIGAKTSGSGLSSPLMSLSGGKKNYAKNPKRTDVEQFGTPGFGLTGMTGED